MLVYHAIKIKIKPLPVISAPRPQRRHKPSSRQTVHADPAALSHRHRLTRKPLSRRPIGDQPEFVIPSAKEPEGKFQRLALVLAIQPAEVPVAPAAPRHHNTPAWETIYQPRVVPGHW